ncbi:sigma-70 family RNA polymerase sigma factor [bacterium]|nr:sigma-70 family RNA polymerase sigma factor [bacterium]
MSHTTRESLLVRIRGGDEVAWEEFHTRYRSLIAWAAGRAGLAGADLDDAVQDVMLELFRGQPTFRYDRTRGRFRDYLFVVTRRAAARARARAARQGVTAVEFPEPAADDGLQAEWEAEWQRTVLREALDVVRGEVEARTFRAFELYELEGRDVAAVATELGVSAATVYQARTRIVRRLRAVADGLAER